MDRSSLSSSACSGCGLVVEFIRRSVQICWREQLLLLFVGWVWFRPWCVDSAVGMPLWRFLAPALQAMQETHTMQGWLKKVHKPLPEPSELGRKTKEPHTMRLLVRSCGGALLLKSPTYER